MSPTGDLHQDGLNGLTVSQYSDFDFDSDFKGFLLKQGSNFKANSRILDCACTGISVVLLALTRN
jgi:hypothetical protein